MLNENTYETKKTEHKEYIREKTNDVNHNEFPEPYSKEYSYLAHFLKNGMFDEFDYAIFEMRNNDIIYPDFEENVDNVLGNGLIWACYYDKISDVKKLIEDYNVDVNFCRVVNNSDGYYYQEYTIHNCNSIEVLEYLLEKGAWINAEHVCTESCDEPQSVTILTLCCQCTDPYYGYGNLAMFKWLLENGYKYGLDVNYIPQHPHNQYNPNQGCANHTSYTPLETGIVMWGEIEKIQMMFNHGANVIRPGIMDVLNERIVDGDLDDKHLTMFSYVSENLKSNKNTITMM